MKIAYALLTTCLVLGGQTPSASKPVPFIASSCCGITDMSAKFTTGEAHIYSNYRYSVSVDSEQSGSVIRITDDEYARLQKLRQAVSNAEAEIAEAHGVHTFIETPPKSEKLLKTCPPDCGFMTLDKQPDHYEYRGQYLLVNVPDVSK